MDYRAICRRELDVMGAFRSPWLRAAFDAVDREAFAPARFWAYETDTDGRHLVVDRGTSEEAWRRAVWNAHRSLITQMDDATTPDTGPAKGVFTSSISALDIVFEKLNHLEVEPGQSVLHIGTASGYDSALLCEGLEDGPLTTVECDKSLAAWGARNLQAAGYAPEVVRGDGLEGWSASAPYDRVVATAAIRHVPETWLAQAGDGAVILAPYNTRFARGGLLKLRTMSGCASGRFVGDACYMWMRSHRPSNVLDPPEEGRKEASPIDPDEVLGVGWPVRFALGLHVPDISFSHRGEGEEKQAQFWDEAGTSVAVVNYDEWWRPRAVTLYGERDLWSEVVQAYRTWRLAGRPHYTRYGLTVDDGGEQLWLDDSARLVPR